MYPARRVGSGRGLVMGFGASMGLIVGFLSTAKGLGVSRGLGPGTGLFGSGVIIWDWFTEGIDLEGTLIAGVSQRTQVKSSSNHWPTYLPRLNLYLSSHPLELHL